MLIFFFLLGIKDSIFCQTDTISFDLEINFNPKAEKRFQSKFNWYKRRRIFNLKFQRFIKGIEFNEQNAINNINQEYVDKIILEDFYNDLTPESKLWLKDFFNNFKPDYISEFDTFYRNNKNKSIKEIKKLYEEFDTVAYESKKVLENNPQIDAPFIKYQIPDDSSLRSSSKFVVTRTYSDNQYRMTVSTPDQSLYLYGQFNNTTMWFPHYENYKKNWCGPAAGQSILAWYSIPVTKNGQILTNTKDIQTELADLMKTGHNVRRDYTKPENLKIALTRDEFLGSKGYCFYRKNATFDHIHNFLSHGKPVIILLAWDTKMHYVTLYGYNESDRKYWVANAVNPSGVSYDYSTLVRRWNFSDVKKRIRIVTALTAINPNMLFAYNDTGCDYEWEYLINHNFIDDVNTDKKSELYFNDFNEKYVENFRESYIDLNFYGKYEFNLYEEPIGPVTKVSSGGMQVSLHPANRHIINYTNPSNLEIDNNCIDRNFEIEIGVDKIFLDNNEELGCMFQILDKNDTIVKTISGNCKNMATSLSEHTNYIFKLIEPYKPQYDKVEFLIHEGWRKKVITLKGCDLDNDNDYICDENDDDDDNDGITDLEDNCPAEHNPLQIDMDGNGVGFECDLEEQCNSNCDSGLYTDNLDREFCLHMCAIKEGSELINTLSVLQNIRALENLNIDIHKPSFKKSIEFNEILTGYNEILKVQGIKVSTGRSKRQLLKLIRKIEFIPH